jgi:hypothetical protein
VSVGTLLCFQTKESLIVEIVCKTVQHYVSDSDSAGSDMRNHLSKVTINECSPDNRQQHNIAYGVVFACTHILCLVLPQRSYSVSRFQRQLQESICESIHMGLTNCECDEEVRTSAFSLPTAPSVAYNKHQ